ncbi:MAG: DUF4956 domain-containing protein [Anaerotignum sp.]
MNFNDILKSSFLENAVAFSTFDVLIAMVLALACGMFILFVYRKTFSGVMYSSGFAVSIVAMTLITTLIILAVTSNIVLSLGMVGALSIVRFRTAVKEPLDIAFVFWSLSVGIVVGAGLFSLAVIGSIFIGVVLLVLVNRKPTDMPYIVLVNMEDDITELKAMDTIKKMTKKSLVKAKTVSANGIELTMEVRLKENSTEFINTLLGLEGVENATLVSNNGDYI